MMGEAGRMMKEATQGRMPNEEEISEGLAEMRASARADEAW